MASIYLRSKQLCGSGSTPTGLSTFDLNSPEPDPVSYGPYPVNRAVQGLKGIGLVLMLFLLVLLVYNIFLII